jgi:hypothetical protein
MKAKDDNTTEWTYVDQQKASMHDIERFRLERERLGHIDVLKLDVLRKRPA